jgi:tetratricopeptide (TPR) repeat protein
MFKNKNYVILGFLIVVTIMAQVGYSQTNQDQILILKEYSIKNENDKVVKLAREILKSDPNNIAVLNLLTEAYINMDNLPAAEETIQKALALKPNDPLASRLLARIYRLKANQDPQTAKDNLALALEQVESGLASDPNNIMLLAEKAQIYLEQGYKDPAKEIINNALTISPNNNYLKTVKKEIETAKIDEKPPLDSP